MRLARHSLSLMAIVGALLLSAGCSILPQAEPTDVYRLSTAQPVAHRALGAPVPWSLRIVRPRASEMLDSPRIAVVPQGNLISNYKGARWSDPAPVALRNRLLDAFYRDGRVQSLSTDDSNLQADFELSGELQAFQSEYHGDAIEVVIRLDARLAGDNQRIVASHRFEVHQAVSDKQVPSIVSGFGKASDTLAAQLLQWTIEQGQTHYAMLPKNQ
ncbi:MULTISPECIES: ABC-type transport auxiliary lipoprotein family protein [unclassified Pseudomonas]|uniref:ABC-type transport auxiliary lipoprotein family protein n=1 Tax=unclassified Pseudomonas TaxID=196821 RepID=UPI002B238122|nr:MULTISPECIES: ABC-type transport auxiliary lipoprotein family protein [unclassified Pseudomonas]MEA9978859.1 ABC-type transport auxiliary lipoprotein family protein [Pseudomonas sp. RTS4]MEB0197368.1 ABC-type transport auxiliary lipoprotein family protein [Pseudomonas sp. 5S4]MEB0247305.1 ABC-type transport auxiliary lipoprotein family protein [Pseudomonas sp. 10S5]